ncbi:uncharacterized protein LOC119109229 [Pollicipes pollicipes]|uniref:uncharacterized protein LOC119109229 n=1 Tax=Pollicipes pollicipes TaxID=41117 RepID=UPI0018851C1E|nr:uncharacterized protein LOC119109229 [Pollicipes pollicipes]
MTLEGQSHVHRLLSGAEHWDGSDGEDGMPMYDEQIAEVGRQWDTAREEELRQQKDVQDLNQKVAGVREAKLWVAKFKRPVPYPRYSHWSKTQQRFVVDMMLRYWATGVPTNPPPAEAQDVQKLVGFIEEMRQEQDEFFTFTREVNATQLGRYNFTHVPIRRYVEKAMRTKLQRVREYPGHYRQIGMLPLAPPAGEPPNFSHLGEPLELGEVPVCVIPDMTYYTDLKKQCVFLEQFFPSSQCYPKTRTDGWKPQDGTFLYKDPELPVPAGVPRSSAIGRRLHRCSHLPDHSC